MNGPYYDYNGNPVSLEAWGILFESSDRILRQTYLERGSSSFFISTVWLGIAYTVDDPPLIFETMIFNEEQGAVAEWRYPYREGAIAHHDMLVSAYLRDGWKIIDRPSDEYDSLQIET